MRHPGQWKRAAVKRPTPRPCRCGKPRAKAWHVACAECWQTLPADLREMTETLYRTKRGSGDHIAIVRQCYELLRASTETTLL